MIVNLKTGSARIEIYIHSSDGTVPILSLSGMGKAPPVPSSTASSIVPKVAVASVVALACGLVGYNLGSSSEPEVASRRVASSSYVPLPRAPIIAEHIPQAVPQLIPQAVPQLIPQATTQREAAAVLREMGQPPVVTPPPIGPAPASGPSANAFGLE